MRVLAIGCHPDDIEIACAGTLAKYKNRGDDVTICHVANGNLGHKILRPKELAVIRKQEAKKAGAHIGSEVLCCDIGDILVYEGDKKQRDAVVEVIRYAKPDVIFTHSPNDYMPDHLAVSRLVFDASFAASVPHYETGSDYHGQVTPLYYMDTLAGLGFVPTEYVDISETMEVKLAMLEEHESQMKWMRDHDNIDFADFVTTCAKFRGLQCGVAYAEAYAQAQVWPKVRPMRMLP